MTLPIPIPCDDEAERGLVGNLLYRRAPDVDLSPLLLHPLRHALAVALTFHRSHCWRLSRSIAVADIEAAAQENAIEVARSIALVGEWSAEEAFHELFTECRIVAAHGIYRHDFWLARLQRAADRRAKLATAEQLMKEAVA
ncbi:MAG: hypothetical protein ACK5Q5_17855 [Planctomycetaceae bacterium]